jgi:hypothetical protein
LAGAEKVPEQRIFLQVDPIETNGGNIMECGMLADKFGERAEAREMGCVGEVEEMMNVGMNWRLFAFPYKSRISIRIVKFVVEVGINDVTRVG